ncbi:phosphomannomutase/phosphoglucomutase [Engelhardtia mirabilis]|uniref:Phosphomannomutase/phosphoglucomutase n=1 Tax=Engelhardtia mirabilis TaxID=2528011 RepID=A0A518BJW8_9BACT|nr:Phosphomannomutase/phosphoglucomutase [Planctomycetes bacterium Pla133]QDV01596.1 Phosphomannomutase/phosphoglucomutase [Planctomycetes bacterium Pla86]
MGIFKAYDIRGVYGSELDADMGRKIGHAFVRLRGAKRLVVGQDMRTHSPELADAVSEGMRDAGCDVLRLGLASTPMTYFGIGSLDCDGGLVVTASHNPGQYNGMKLCGPGAVPISGDTGIMELERMCAEPYPGPLGERGTEEHIELLDAYADHVASFAHLQTKVVLAIDAANGMAGHTLPKILERLPLVEAHSILMEPDGNFPVHEANPLIEENLEYVAKVVREHGARLGVSFDGDADRCCFVDEAGRTISADLMTALIARHFLKQRGPAPILYDLRSSWVVKEEIAAAGGEPIRERVGHSFIKATMRAKGAVFGGELSGHFYFADNFTTDSGVIAMVTALTVLDAPENRDRPMSELVADLRRYHSTGEINFRVPDKDEAIAQIKQRYASGRQDELDGITVEFGDLADADWWWFNVRASNTEPLLRLNLEARTAELRDAKRDELVGLLGEPV